MADVRITPGSQALTPVQPAARTEAVKAAQRAFFNAALTQTQAQPELRRTVSTPTISEPQVTRLDATVVKDAASAGRILRPGSLLDIKV